MRNFALLLALLPFTACTSGGKDTGDTSAPADTDTDTDTDTDADFQMIDFSGACDQAAGTCDYTITTSTPADIVDLDMTETDDSYLYHEYHDEFVLDSTNADGSETYLLHLTAVSDPADVTAGTTLFFASTVLDGTTWLFTATNSAGAFDCVVTGDDVGYYSTICTNVE